MSPIQDRNFGFVGLISVFLYKRGKSIWCQHRFRCSLFKVTNKSWEAIRTIWKGEKFAQEGQGGVLVVIPQNQTKPSSDWNGYGTAIRTGMRCSDHQCEMCFIHWIPIWIHDVLIGEEYGPPQARILRAPFCSHSVMGLISSFCFPFLLASPPFCQPRPDVHWCM